MTPQAQPSAETNAKGMLVRQAPVRPAAVTPALWSATARVSTSLTSFSATGAAFGCVFCACIMSR